jgi:proteasome alpha subunit
MSMPFYVAPEQLMKDKADYARRNIARGRPLVASAYNAGILIAAENTYRHLHKISEIYDRIAFAGVGKYNEFEQLRRSGVQHADVKGYQFSREDVDARSLANLYSQYMGQIFTHDMKPLEAEILVAEVGPAVGEDEIYHVTFDGFVFDESRFVVLGGEAETITERMEAAYQDGWELGAAVKAATGALAGDERTVPPEELEIAVLEREATGRAFRRVETAELTSLLQ